MEYEVKRGKRRSPDSDWQSVTLGYHPMDKSHGHSCCYILFTRTGLVAFFLAYLSLGAYMFMAIESGAGLPDHVTGGGQSEERGPVPDGQSTKLRKDQVLDRLWDITENLNILYKDNWTSLASDEVGRFHDSVYSLAMNECSHRCQQMALTTPATETTSRWNYPTAFLYALAVTTTLGSCPVTPQTTAGKLLTIMYAGFGIPLLLIYLTVVGSSLSACLCRCFRRPDSSGRYQRKMKEIELRGAPDIFGAGSMPSPPPSHKPLGSSGEMSFIGNNCSVSLDMSMKNGPEGVASVPPPPPPPPPPANANYWPIVICFLMAAVYVAVGGFVFSTLMSLSFVDALFLSFMLFTTMGIPDSHKDGVWTRGGAVVGAVLYILVGLTLCSLCFNLIYEWLVGPQPDNQLQQQRYLQHKLQKQRNEHNMISTKM